MTSLRSSLATMTKRNTAPSITSPISNGINGIENTLNHPLELESARLDVPIMIDEVPDHKIINSKLNHPTRGFFSFLFPRPKETSHSLHTTRRSKLRKTAFYREVSSKKRRWSFPKYMAATLWIATFVQAVVLVISMQILNRIQSPIQIQLQRFPPVPYEHIDTRRPIGLTNDTRVYHVTKEFSLASMGGLGTVLTALATAQQQSSYTDISIVMPSYNFMRVKFRKEIKNFCHLSVTVKDRNGKHINTGFKVHKINYQFSSQDLLNPDPEIAFRQSTNKLKIYLIGKGDVYPFNQAFRAKDVNEIYSSPKGLPQEWMNLYFNKAAAEFIAFQSLEDAPLFDTKKREFVAPDIVHIHGATNAMLAHYLKDFERRGMLGANPPSIVYTMHDYLDELQYSVTVNNLRYFIGADGEDIDVEFKLFSPYIHGHRMFPSALGIDAADMVTFVSQYMAADMVEGRLNFYLKELVMPSIIERARQSQFVGISNGIDLNSEKSPFTNSLLLAKHLNFPRPDDLLGSNSLKNETDLIGEYPPEKEFLIYAQKQKAKKFLVQREQLPAEDEETPIILFIGRFQYNKGCEFLRPAAEVIANQGAKLVIMGQRNNYPLHFLRELREDYPETVIVIHSALLQKKHGIIWRAAADYLLVPSVTESFGLVAVEGLLFGSGIISSGVGGLSEFLVGKDADDTFQKSKYNSYLFDIFAPDSTDQLQNAVKDALIDLKDRNSKGWIENELFVRRMVRNAMALSWDRKNGPADLYARVYKKSMEWRLEDPDSFFEQDADDDNASLRPDGQANVGNGDIGFDVVDGQIVELADEASRREPLIDHSGDDIHIHVHSNGHRDGSKTSEPPVQNI